MVAHPARGLPHGLFEHVADCAPARTADTATMRAFGAPSWVVVAVRALASYLAAFMVTLLWLTMTNADPGGEFAALNREVALYAGVTLGLPTIALTLLLLVRRVARPIAVVAGLWMAFNAFLWLPVLPVLAVWAAGVAAVVLSAAAAGPRRDQLTSTHREPHG